MNLPGLDNVAVIAGTDTDFGLPKFAPCEDCGEPVDLASWVTVTVIEADGSEVGQQMSEANARQLMLEVGLIPPPVLCDRHHYDVIETEACRG